MNYEETSDETIEMHVHSALGLPGDGAESKSYCGSPSDAWPIIVENKINIEFFGERVKASTSIKTDFGCEFINDQLMFAFFDVL